MTTLIPMLKKLTTPKASDVQFWGQTREFDQSLIIFCRAGVGASAGRLVEDPSSSVDDNELSTYTWRPLYEGIGA